MNVKNNSFVPGWPILMNVKWQWKNIKNKNAFLPQGDQLTSKTCSLGKLKREMTIVVSGLTSLSHSPHSYIIYIIIFSDHYHIIFSHLFCSLSNFCPPNPLFFFLLFWLLTLSLTRWSTRSVTQPTLEQLLVMSSRWLTFFFVNDLCDICDI